MEKEALPHLLHFGRPQVHDRKAEQGERERLMAKREPIGATASSVTTPSATWSSATRGKDRGAARERRSRRGAQRAIACTKREGDNAIGDHPMIELRGRHIVEDRARPARTERLSRNQGPIPSAARCCR